MGLCSVIVMITATAFVASRHNPVFVPSSSSQRQQQQQHSPLKTNHPLKAAAATTTYTTAHAAVGDDSNWLQERLQSHDLQVAHFPSDAATTTTTAGSCSCLIRGIQTLRDRQPGELLLSVPSSYVLFPQKIWNEYPHIRRAVQKAEQHAALLLSNSQILTLALGILQLRQVNDNDPCICSLPEKQYSVPLMPDAIKDCLPPTYQRAFDRIQKQHNDVYETVYQSLQDQQDEQEEESSQQQQQVLLLQPPSRTDFLWAVASIQSRSFNADGSNQDDEGGSSSTWRIMLPGIDLINHKFGNEASLQYNADERQYEFRSNVSFDSGDEVTYSYGHDADNLSLLMNFGFCIPNNPQRLISFDLDNVLQAAQSLVPNIYPDPILAMLKTQLQQQQGNKLLFSEGNLFGYDGNTRAVAAQNDDDLVKATSMVQALGEQLAEMPLTGLDAAMVPKMLAQRKYDLHKSLKRLEKVKVDDGDWQPFVSSIRTLLQDELQTLHRL